MQDTANSVLSALVAVAAHHGIDTSVETLRRRFVLSADHIDGAAFVNIANEIGLTARGVRANWSDLPRFERVVPAVLVLRNGQALILEGIGVHKTEGAKILVRDPDGPSDARAVIDEAQLRGSWDGEIILVKRRRELSDAEQPFGLRWIVGQILTSRAMLRDIVLASVVATVFAIAPPFIAIIVIDRVIVNQSWSTLAVLSLVFFLMIMFEPMLLFIRRTFMESMVTRIDGTLNLYILNKVLRLPMEYFETIPGGAIVGKLNRVYEIRTFFTGSVLYSVLDSVVLLLIVPILFVLNWFLALIVLTCAGAIFGIIYAYLKPMARLHSKLVQSEIEKHSHLYETVLGMRAVKSLALEGRRRLEWDARVATSSAARHALGSLSKYPQTLVIPFERLMYAGAILIGAAMALNSMQGAASAMNTVTNMGSALGGQPGMAPAGPVMPPGVVMGFAMLAARAAVPLIHIATLQQDLQVVRGAIIELASVMNVPPEEDRAGTGLRMPIRGDISFQNVTFRYSPSAPRALDDVTFDIRPGTIFGIMGRSGSGKTTVTRLLQGLNPAYDGIIKMDGMDLREIELHHLRTHVGVVAQESFLFRGSVRENIAMARPNASFAEVVRAAQLAGAEEFIEKLPRGYDTLLAESATNLSGGQRQRLSIARALIIDPPVLILDEATSALDAESEAIINANLMRIAKDRTIICVSHRLSMLVNSDAILVMEKGQVDDIGRHEELLQRCDIYKHMWYQQNRHVEQPSAHAPIAILGSQTAR